MPNLVCQGFYDVASLYALPPQSRYQYINKLIKLTSHDAKGLLVTIDSKRINDGPTYFISELEVSRLYSQHFAIKRCAPPQQKQSYTTYQYTLSKKVKLTLTLPSLEHLLAYTNENLITRYENDYPNNLLSGKEALSNLVKYLWLGQKHFIEHHNNPNDDSLDFILSLQAEMKEIDDMWHTFLLFTVDYRKFCQRYFGCFIDHIPIITVDESANESDSEANMTKWLSYVYDNLGAEVLKTWFSSYFERTCSSD